MFGSLASWQPACANWQWQCARGARVFVGCWGGLASAAAEALASGVAAGSVHLLVVLPPQEVERERDANTAAGEVTFLARGALAHVHSDRVGLSSSRAAAGAHVTFSLFAEILC